MEIFPKTIRFEGYKIKEPAFLDVVKLNKNVIEKHFWTPNLERNPNEFEVLVRFREYVLNNSNLPSP